MKLSKEQARELAYGCVIPELGLTVESDEPIYKSRWTMQRKLVVKDKAGLYWATTYERGLTENQDIKPFEYAPDEIEFELAEKVPVVTYEYREVKPGEGGVSEPAGDSPDSPAPGESRVPGGSDDYLPVAYAGDDPADLWPNILRVEPDEFIKAAL